MAHVSGVIDIKSNGFRKLILGEYSSDFNLILPENLVYDIGIDQSSSCTGFYICDTKSNINILLEFARDTSDSEAFYRDLQYFIGRVTKDRNIRLVVCEDPPYVKGKQYSSRLLLELRGKLSGWMSMIPALEKAELKSIYPQTWKSLIVDKSKGKNRSNVKKFIADDVCDILPCFAAYKDYGVNKDYDGFDATGILLGYKKYAYTEDGIPLICGKQEKRHTSLVWYRYEPVEIAQDKYKLNAIFGDAIIAVKPEFKMFNPRYNKHTNIRMASSNSRFCTYTILSEKEFNVIRFKYDLEKKDDHVLLMYVMNESSISRGLRNLLKSMFPMNEEVVEI